MEFIDKELLDYAESHTSPAGDVLESIERDTYATVMMPKMLSGHLQGRAIAMFTHMIKPKYILEIGTYTGYSAIAMAEGLKAGGKLVTIDINEEIEARTRKNIALSPVNELIDYKLGNALAIIPSLPYLFDLVFIDADKINYSNYFDMAIEKVPTGGYIIADNVLWSGKVLEKNRKKLDEDTNAIIAFNEKVQGDPRVENVLLPVRDGLMIIRKK